MSTFTGVQFAEIGARYDVAIGFDNGSGTANMVGYVLAAGTNWEESTNIQDNDRLVQIASDNQTDRFTYYPKISQGDWSGGERQINFVDPTRYFSSTHMETSIPGELQILGTEVTSSISGLTVGTTPSAGARPIETDALLSYVRTTGGASGNYVTVTNGVGSSASAQTVAAGSALSSLIRGAGGIYGFTATGVWQLNGNVQCVNDPTATGVVTITSQLAYNAGKFFYATGNTPWNLKFFQNHPFPGAAPGTQVLAHNQSEARPSGLVGGGIGVVYGASDGGGTPPTFTPNETYLWQSDGTATETYIGVLPGDIADMVNVAGTIYILAFYLAPSNAQFPIIYTLTNDGVVSVFDDYRVLDPRFQPTITAAPGGNLSSDGRFLYMALGRLGIKRYDLTKTATGNAVADVTPSTIDTVTKTGIWATAFNMGFSAIQNDDTKVVGVTGYGTNAVSGTGTLTTSFFDFRTPTTYKLWRSFEVSLQTYPISGTLAVTATVDNTSAIALTAVTLSNGNLVYYFPQNTKGLKCQFVLTFTSSAGAGPVVLQYAVRATLARAFKFTVQARRQIVCHDGSQDTQGVSGTTSLTGSSQFLVGNLENAFRQASGNVTMYIPSPSSVSSDSTHAAGVEVVSAVIENYTWKSPKPGPSFSEQSAPDMEGDVDITAVEVLL